jgi:hypothetical protein
VDQTHGSERFAVKEPYARARIIDMAVVLALTTSVAACETLPRTQDLPSVQSPPPGVNSEAVPARQNCSFESGGFSADLNQFALNHFPLDGFPENPFVNQCWPN